MRCIISSNTNPHYNLAAEEYFLKNYSDTIFMIYINEPCIVVGKHQNLLSEINLPFVKNHNIKLARRITGGGAVYHDFNNLNFSFIHNCVNFEKINLALLIQPVVNALKAIGLTVVLSTRNDLLIEAKKVSGNAMHIFKTRVLSHGTLLFNTNKTTITAALSNNSQKYIDKSIKSVRSEVTNLVDYLNHPMTMDNFTQTFFEQIVEHSFVADIRPISDNESSVILQLSKNKFETWEWNYGYSPNYLFINSFCISNQKIDLEIKVEKGIIRSIFTNFLFYENIVYHNALETLLNVKHEYNTIHELLNDYNKNNSTGSINIEELLKHLF